MLGSRTPGWVRALEVLVVLTILFFIGRYLWIQFGELDMDSLHFRTWRILTSIVIVTAAYLLSALVIRGYFRELGVRVGARSAIALATVPGLAKYLPGKIHSTLGVVWMAHRLERVPVEAGATVAVFIYIQAVVVGIVCSAILAPFTGIDLRWKILLWVLALLGLAALHPALFMRPVNWLLKKIRRQPLTDRVRFLHVLGFSGIVVVQSLIAAGMFVLLASGLIDLPPGSEPHLAFSFILAALSGFLAFFAPAGIGVQEGALVLLLSPVIPPDQAAMLAVAARIWQTVMILAGAGIGGLALVIGKPSMESDP